MNHSRSLYLTFVSVLVLLLASCGKLRNNDIAADPNAKQHNEDLSHSKSESDNLNADINSVMRELSGFAKQDQAEAISICGATIDSSQQYDPVPTVYINFDGTTVCGSPARKRSGQVKVELIQGSRWADQGAVLRVTHIDYKVTFVTLNNHFLTFNGTKYITNVDGISWYTYFLTGSLTARFRERSDDMLVTFENGQTAAWNSARLSTWQISNYTTITATVNGDTTINGKTIDSWGVTRFGTNFITEMIQPWKSGTACGWWKPTEGKYTSVTDNFSVTATLGVNSNGNPVSSGCAYGFKLNWTVTSPSASGETVIRYF